jgi:hypothetical protein
MPSPRRRSEDDPELGAQEVVVDPLQAAGADELAVAGRVHGEGHPGGARRPARLGHLLVPALLGLDVDDAAMRQPAPYLGVVEPGCQ